MCVENLTKAQPGGENTHTHTHIKYTVINHVICSAVLTKDAELYLTLQKSLQ